MKKTVDSVIYEHLVVFIVLWEVLQAEDYVIIQRKSSTSSGNNTWKAQPDQFIIPSSLCVGNGSTQCEEMGGSRISNCKCECDHMASNGKDFSSSTFGLDGGRWKCLENAKVHERSGCSVILNNWANDSALITVPMVGVANYEIPTQFRFFQIYKPTSKAQNCDNSWMYLDYDTYVKKRFSVHRIDNKQYLKFIYSGISSQQITTGRIIKLGVGYYNASNKIIHTCVLLKTQGEIQCPFSLPPTATPFTTKPSSLSTTVESRLSTSTRIATNPNPNTPSSDFPTVTKPTGETSVPMFIKTSAKNTSSDDRSGLIAGAVAGVIGFIALVIVIILVRRRKKRTTVTKRTDIVQGHNGFGTHHVQRSLEDDDQEEYSYAYASAVSINKQDVDHHPKNKESPIPAADYVNQGNSDFNISDELEYEIMTNTETADESKAIKQKEQTSETLDSTMYGSLVGNVPHVYGSLKGPHKTHEDETDRQVTCTSQNKENDTYQQLNTFGQQNHEYQAPNWSA